MGHTYRCQIWGWGGVAFWQLLLWWLSADIWVIHTGAKSGGEVVTLFDSYSYDGWVLVYGSYIQMPNLDARWWRFLTVIWWHMNLCMVAHLWSTNIFGYDKLWGPSQRVVTLLNINRCECSIVTLTNISRIQKSDDGLQLLKPFLQWFLARHFLL